MKRARYFAFLIMGGLAGCGPLAADDPLPPGQDEDQVSGPSACAPAEDAPRCWPARGIGVAAFDFSAGPGQEMPDSATLLIRADPGPESSVVARFHFLSPEPFSWSYALQTEEEAIEENLLEFDYEVLGLPVDSIETALLVRVIYGRSAEGELRRGWVRLEPGHSTLVRWAEELPEKPLFLLGDAEHLAFHASPEGDRVPFELVPGSSTSPPHFDHRLEPLETRGRWMKVRVVTPDDGCMAEPVETREETLWIEFLGQEGWPRVWFYSRGC